MDLQSHPTVRSVRARGARNESLPLSAQNLRELCLKAGADDVGFVEIDRPEIADQKNDILELFPATKTLISIVRRMNRENIRRSARSVANLEFHHSTDEINGTALEIVRVLERYGYGAVVAGAAGFPMEADRWGRGKMWLVSHKPVAVAAGLGRMGIHRNVIHPVFGNFIALETILVDVAIDEMSQPIDYNPCLECKLCVAACPTGAIGSDGSFNFSACYTHNYREFMGGFVDFVHTLADSRNAEELAGRVSDAETVSWWQSLSYGANYKAAYCMAVCPAGEDVISPFLEHRKQYLDDVVKPLREKDETIYVLADSDAEAHVAKHFPSKRAKRVSNGLVPDSIEFFLRGLPLSFQPDRSTGLNARFQFEFTGAERAQATVDIRDKRIGVTDGRSGMPDVTIVADSRTWLRVLQKPALLVVALLTRRIRIKGAAFGPSLRLFAAFGRCFPR